MNKRTIGTKYEQMAAIYLEQQGVSILERNFRSRFGEIDLIGYDRGTYLFVEVKYRKTSRNGNPACAVTASKQYTICKVADYYRVLHGIGDNMACRFDVVTILGEELSWYQNAFQYRHR